MHFTTCADGLPFHVKFCCPRDQEGKLWSTDPLLSVFQNVALHIQINSVLAVDDSLTTSSQNVLTSDFQRFGFSGFWQPPKKHKLILYVTRLIYLRCMCYVARAMRSELKDRAIHSIFMIIKLLHHVITREKCSEIWSMQNSQTFVASPSGLWFIQIVGAISWWLHWNHEDWTHFLCRESELPPVPLPCAVCLWSLRSWLLDVWVAQRGYRAAVVQ